MSVLRSLPFLFHASYIQMYHNLFTQCFIGGHLGCVLEYAYFKLLKKQKTPE